MSGPGQIFVITLGPERQAAGSIGDWEMPGWQGETVWETGYSVLSAFQGQGVATRAMVFVIPRAAAEGDPFLDPRLFPSVDNGPSNAVCRKAGFTLLGAHDFEYPPGSQLRCNDWAFDLDLVRG